MDLPNVRRREKRVHIEMHWSARVLIQILSEKEVELAEWALLYSWKEEQKAETLDTKQEGEREKGPKSFHRTQSNPTNQKQVWGRRVEKSREH